MIKFLYLLSLALYQQTVWGLNEVPQDQDMQIVDQGEGSVHPLKEALNSVMAGQEELKKFLSQFSEEELKEFEQKAKQNYIEQRLADGSKDPELDRKVTDCFHDKLRPESVENRYERIIGEKGWEKAGIKHVDEKIWTDYIYNSKIDSKPWLLTVARFPKNAGPNRPDVLESALDRLICFATHYGDEYNYGWIEWDTEFVREALNLRDKHKDLNFLAVQDGKLYHKSKESSIQSWIEFAANPAKFAAFTDSVPAARNSVTIFVSYAYNTLPYNVGFRQVYNLMQQEYNDTFIYQSIVKPLFSPLNRDQTIGFNIIVYILVPLVFLVFLSLYLVLKLFCCCFCSKKQVQNTKPGKKDN